MKLALHYQPLMDPFDKILSFCIDMKLALLFKRYTDSYRKAFNQEDTLDEAQNIEVYHHKIPNLPFSYYKQAYQQNKNHYDCIRIPAYHYDIPACDIILHPAYSLLDFCLLSLLRNIRNYL